MAFRAWYGHPRCHNRWIIGLHLLRERIIGRKLVQYHQSGDACGRIFPRFADKFPLGQLAMDIAVENLENIGVKVTGLHAACWVGFRQITLLRSRSCVSLIVRRSTITQ